MLNGAPKALITSNMSKNWRKQKHWKMTMGSEINDHQHNL